MQPMFTPGEIYKSLTHGIVEFKGTDTYRGETTFHFRSLTYRADCYWLPDALPQHLDTQLPNTTLARDPAADDAVRAKARAEDPGGEDLCGWSFERGWRAAEDAHGITPAVKPNT